MKFAKCHIGREIEAEITRRNVTRAELARKIGIQPQNIGRLFEKESIDTERLIAISEALDFDFFVFYRSDEHLESIANEALAAGDGAAAASGYGARAEVITNTNTATSPSCAGSANVASQSAPGAADINADRLMGIIDERDRTIATLTDRIADLTDRNMALTDRNADLTDRLLSLSSPK